MLLEHINARPETRPLPREGPAVDNASAGARCSRAAPPILSRTRAEIHSRQQKPKGQKRDTSAAPSQCSLSCPFVQRHPPLLGYILLLDGLGCYTTTTTGPLKRTAPLPAFAQPPAHSAQRKESFSSPAPQDSNTHMQKRLMRARANTQPCWQAGGHVGAPPPAFAPKLDFRRAGRRTHPSPPLLRAGRIIQHTHVNDVCGDPRHVF
jgi:hypothetical protein